MDDVTPGAGGAIRVGDFVLDPRSGEVRGPSGRHVLPAQPLNVLLALAEHPGELVTREELRQRLWPADTFVDFEHGLNAVVKRLRDLLGDTADTPRYIETVPRRGYRLVAAVHREGIARAEPASSQALVATSPQVRMRRPRGLVVVAASVLAALALALGVIAFRNRLHDARATLVEASAATPLEPKRLTFGSGLQTGATWSPDGRRIAFAWDRDGNFDLFTVSADGEEPVRITSTRSNDTEPAWSPDGRRLVFRSEQDGGGLFTVDASGGPVRRITNHGVLPAWLPDGRDIVFSDTEARALYLVRADGGEPPREIFEGQLTGGVWSSVAVHPDGRIGVIGIHRTTRFGFYVGDRANRRLQAVDTRVALPLGWQTAFPRVHWNATGTALFVEALAAGVPAIWRVPVDPGTLAWQPPVRLTTALASADRAAISPDGTRLAFTRSDATTRAWLFPFDADAGRPPGDGRAVGDENASTIVSLWLSADGSSLFFAERQPGRDTWRGLRTNLDTGHTTQISEGHDSIAFIPSPDGRFATYMLKRPIAGSTTGEFECALAVRDFDGTERLVGSWGAGVFLPSDWSHEDRVLGTMMERTYTGPSPLVEWPIGPSAAAKPSRILMDSPTKQFWQGRYSPDGRLVAFVVRTLGPAKEVVELGIASAGSERATTWTRLAADHARPDKPRWSPDGRTLYFLSPAPAGFFNLWGVHVDPKAGVQLGTPFQVTHFDSPRWNVDPDMGGASELGIAKDRLVLPMRSVTGSIWLIPVGDT